MRDVHSRVWKRTLTGIFLGAIAAGCTQNNNLPGQVEVELPDGTTVQTTLGSGVLSLADSTWDFFRTGSSAQGAAFVRVQFGPEGQLTRFENNTIAREIFGATIIFDGARHNTTQQGLQYAAATYGAETADSTGFSFQGLLTAFFGGLEAANATASAAGTFDADDPNVVRGTFAFSSRVTLLSIPEGNQDDEFSFEARKVDGE